MNIEDNKLLIFGHWPVYRKKRQNQLPPAEESRSCACSTESEKSFHSEEKRNLRNAIRFFVLMLILTLIARGTSGATMPVVGLKSPAPGTIKQEANISGTVIKQGGDLISLPDGLTVEQVYVQSGQTIGAGDILVSFSLDEVKESADELSAELQKQQAQLNQLKQTTPVDYSGVQSAQTTLDRANEDYDRTVSRQQALVDDAQQQVNSCQESLNAAQQALDTLQQQVDPPASQEELHAAQNKVDAAKAALDTAENNLKTTKQGQEDALLNAQRNIEDAQNALDQAQNSYAQNQSSQQLATQSNQADAAIAELEIDKLQAKLQLLNELIENEGAILSPTATTVLECNLSAGEKTANDTSILRLANDESNTYVTFNVPQENADKLSVGKTVSVIQGNTTVDGTIETILFDEEGENAEINAIINDDEIDSLKPGQQVQVNVSFSSTNYDYCLPINAIREDVSGHFVLVVEEKQTSFGITNTAVRVPVTVLEISSDGTMAAISGGVTGNVIVSSDRNVSAGSSVRIAE